MSAGTTRKRSGPSRSRPIGPSSISSCPRSATAASVPSNGRYAKAGQEAQSASAAMSPPARVIESFALALLRRGRQIVKLDDRVRLGPDAELSGVLERAVMVVDHLGAVEEDLDVVADHLHRQFVPRTRRNLPIPAGEAVSFPFDDMVQVDVVFERVRSRDVVVVGILDPPDDPASLVAFSGDRLALHRQPKVLELRTRVGDREPV